MLSFPPWVAGPFAAGPKRPTWSLFSCQNVLVEPLAAITENEVLVVVEEISSIVWVGNTATSFLNPLKGPPPGVVAVAPIYSGFTAPVDESMNELIIY